MYEKARRRAEETARSSEGASIPLPNNRTLGGSKVRDAQELLAVQNATNSIHSRAENRKAKVPKGMSAGVEADVVHEAYCAAMEDLSGIEADVQGRAAIRAGEALGLSPADVVAGHLDDGHVEAAERAGRTGPARSAE